jgi:phage terminase large subunit-like protein
LGLRGKGAIGLRARGLAQPSGAAPTRSKRSSWERKGLSRAERVIAFIESLTITSGAHAGRPFKLRPWQKEIVRAWYSTGPDGKRLVRSGLLSIARKNGKSSLLAAIATAHIVGPEVEPRGQVVSLAADRAQAALIFDEIVAFVLANPAYADRVNVIRHSKELEDLVTGTKFRALSSDAARAHGLSPSLTIVDELAQWGTGRGRSLYEAVVTATGARAEPLTIVISTQTSDENNLMSELVDYGKQVNAGAIEDPTFSAHIFDVPMDADIWDESVWPLANPALGDFRSLPEMRAFAKRARKMPSLQAMFQAYYLNQRVQAEVAWLPVAEWDACKKESPSGDSFSGRRAWIGLDLSANTDLTALSIVLPTDAGYVVKVEYFMPADYVDERAAQDRVPYRVWVEQGWITATPGNSTDYSYVAKRLRELMSEFDVQQIGADPWNARQLVLQLQQDGLPIVEVQQSMKNLSHATKELERLVLGRRLAHDGNPVLRWNVTNAIAERDANENVRLSKRRSTARIDGLAATITGLGLALVHEGPSVYDSRGPLLVDF